MFGAGYEKHQYSKVVRMGEFKLQRPPFLCANEQESSSAAALTEAKQLYFCLRSKTCMTLQTTSIQTTPCTYHRCFTRQRFSEHTSITSLFLILQRVQDFEPSIELAENLRQTSQTCGRGFGSKRRESSPDSISPFGTKELA